MKPVIRLRRLGLAGIVVLAAGCAGHYDEPGTSTYVLGTIFIIVGLVVGVALVMSLGSD